MKIDYTPLSMDTVRNEPITVDITAMIEGFTKGVQKIVDNLADWLQMMANYDYQTEKWVRSLPTRGWIQDGHAYLIVRDNSVRGRWVILKEKA